MIDETRGQISPLPIKQAADIILTAKATWSARGATLVLSPDGARYLAVQGRLYRVPGWIGVSNSGGPDLSFKGPGALFRCSAMGTDSLWTGLVSDPGEGEADLVIGSGENFNVKKNVMLITLSPKKRALLIHKNFLDGEGGYKAVQIDFFPGPVEFRIYRQEPRIYFSAVKETPMGSLIYQARVEEMVNQFWEEGESPLIGGISPWPAPSEKNSLTIGIARPVIVWDSF